MKKHKNIKLYFLIFCLTTIVVTIFFLIKNFWFAFLINQIIIFIAFFLYLKTIKPRDKKFKKITFFIGSILLQFFIGYGTNLTYNQIYPADERKILGISEKTLDNTEKIIELVNEDIQKFKILIKETERNQLDISSSLYLAKKLAVKNQKYESIIFSELIESGILTNRVKGFLLLTFSEKNQSYKNNFFQEFNEFSNNLGHKNINYQDVKTISELINLSSSNWSDEDLINLSKIIIPKLKNNFQDKHLKIKLTEIALGIFPNNYNLWEKEPVLFIDLLIITNEFIKNEDYDILEPLIPFSSHQFLSFYLKTVKEITCKGTNQKTLPIISSLEEYMLDLAYYNDDLIKKTFEKHIGPVRNFETLNANEQVSAQCKMYESIINENYREIDFWLDSDKLEKSKNNPEYIINKIINKKL